MSDEFGEPDATAVVFAMVAATAVGDPLGAAVLVEDLPPGAGRCGSKPIRAGPTGR